MHAVSIRRTLLNHTAPTKVRIRLVNGGPAGVPLSALIGNKWAEHPPKRHRATENLPKAAYLPSLCAPLVACPSPWLHYVRAEPSAWNEA